MSALLFSPEQSAIRMLFQHEVVERIAIKPTITRDWSACLQTLGTQRLFSSVNSVVFSHDSAKLASASEDRTVKIWDASNGACIRTLQGHKRSVISVAFSHDSTKLASVSDDRTMKIWDASSGACIRTLKGHDDYVLSLSFSHNLTRLALVSNDNAIKICDASNRECIHTLQGHESKVTQIAFSHDSNKLALGIDLLSLPKSLGLPSCIKSAASAVNSFLYSTRNHRVQTVGLDK
jgi:WD40 repeat protein